MTDADEDGSNSNNNKNKKIMSPSPTASTVSSANSSSGHKKSYTTQTVCCDGNWAIAHAAYRINDCAFIFPITPSSPMGEYSDEFASKHGMINIYGQKMNIVEMQSEAGAGTYVLAAAVATKHVLLAMYVPRPRWSDAQTSSIVSC